MAFKQTTPLVLKERLERGEHPLIIDTLAPEHYAKIHLPGARQACVFEVSFLDQVAGIAPDKDGEIILYGSSPRTHDALAAADKLSRAGYKNPVILFGGLAAWRDAGLKFEGENPDGPDEAAKNFLAPQGKLRLVPAESLFEWTGRNHNKKHWGTLTLEGAELSFEQQIPSGWFQIDMASMKNSDLEGDPYQPVLISHLMSDDFFFSKLFPKARFTITHAGLLPSQNLTMPNYEIGGDLELRGVKHYLKFQAAFNNLDDGRVAMEAHFDFDRTLWGSIYGSSRFFEHLSYHLVFDMISVSFRLVFEQ